MCQAFEGERRYMDACDEFTRLKGYNAQKAGVAREDCPERDHPLPEYSDVRQWQTGWDTAAAGREPW